MAFVLDNESFSELYKEIDGNYAVWMNGLGSLSSSLEKVINNKEFQGEGAESLKLYLQITHENLIQSLKLIVNNHKGNFDVYKKEYYEKIETDNYGRIESHELDEIKSSLDSTNGKAKTIDTNLTSALNRVSDIYSVRRQNLTSVTYDHDRITKQIDKLIKDVQDCENKHYNSDFTNTGALIKSVQSTISQCQSKKRDFKANFSVASLSEISSIYELGVAQQNASDEAKDNEQTYRLAAESGEKHVAEIKEDREKKAAVIKWVVTGLTVVASVAVIAATGGTATPLVLGALGAATSVATTVTDDLTDEYVNHGNLTKYNNWKRVNYDKLGKDVVVSGVSGFVEGYVGGQAGKAIGQIGPLKTLSNSSSFGKRVLASSVKEGMKSVIEGETKRVVSSAVEEGWNGITGKGFNGDNIVKSATNWKEMGKDLGKGVLSGAIDEAGDSFASKTHIDHYGLNNKNKVIRGSTGFAVDGTKKVAEGITDRAIDETDKVLSGDKSVNEALKDTFDGKEMLNDFVKGGADGAANQVAGNAVNGKEISLKDLKDENIRSKIPTDVISDPEKWVKNGGSIHMDSKGQVTFESRDMKARNTAYKEPTDVIYYDDKGKVDYDRSTIDTSQHQVGGHMTSSKNK